MQQPRQPTDEEISELVQFNVDKMARHCFRKPEEKDFECVRACAIDACIAVFDNYDGYTAEYRGKLMIVVWPEGHNAFDTYIWQDGKISEVTQYFPEYPEY